MSNLKKYKDKKGNSTAHLYRDVKSGIFFAVLRVGTKIKKRSLETSDYLEAIGKLPGSLVDLGSTNESDLKSVPNKLVKEFWNDFYKERKSFGVSERTLNRMDIIWRHHLENYFGNLRPQDIEPDMMPKFIEWHHRTSPGVQLYNTFKYARALFNFMHRREAISLRQIPSIRLPKKEILHQEKKKGRVITHSEFEALVENACNDRIGLMIQIAYYTGVRKMELGALEKIRVLDENGRLFIDLQNTNTKTGIARCVPIPKPVASKFRVYLKVSKTRYVFPTRNGEAHIPGQLIDRDWLKTKRLAGIKGKLRFHDLRHTCATNMAKAGVDVVMATSLLGMSIKTYQDVYLNLKKEDLILTVDQNFEGTVKP